MDWIGLITALSGGAATFGGIELLKWLYTRSQSKRIAEAQADADEFHGLREQCEFLQEQIVKKEERFEQQTQKLREAIDKQFELQEALSKVQLDLQKFRCERAKCSKRLPPNGF